MRGGKVKSTKLEIDLIALQGTLPRVQADSLWEWEGGSAPFFWGLHVSYIDQARYWVGPCIKEVMLIFMRPHSRDKDPFVSLKVANKVKNCLPGATSRKE